MNTFKPGDTIVNHLGQRGVVRKSWTTNDGTIAYLVRFPGGEEVVFGAYTYRAE
jgi:hypothetical protein